MSVWIRVTEVNPPAGKAPRFIVRSASGESHGNAAGAFGREFLKEPGSILVDVENVWRPDTAPGAHPTPEQWAAAKPVQGSRPIRIEVVARVELVRDLRWK